MRTSRIGAVVTGLICAGLVYLVFKVAVGWADWVVVGMLVVTFIGAAIAVYPRQYPSRKRAYTRDSEDKFRRPG
jgi:O-antigen/teichoic acid export membrane protein